MDEYESLSQSIRQNPSRLTYTAVLTPVAFAVGLASHYGHSALLAPRYTTGRSQ